MPQRKGPSCDRSARPFDPAAVFLAWGPQFLVQNNRDFAFTIIKIFSLIGNDNYKYFTSDGITNSTVTLKQAQMALDRGNLHGYHAWYLDEDGNEIPPPPKDDLIAYTSIFDSSKSLPGALAGFLSNSRKGSRRQEIATYLSSKLYISPNTAHLLPKSKPRTHINPYYDIWAWSCVALEWGGPFSGSTRCKIGHHILPILYHHFGCVVPSYSALWLIAQLAQPDKPKEPKNEKPKPDSKPKRKSKTILDIGSGSGYWTYALRNLSLPSSMHPLHITPIDSLQSAYRTLWIPDTVVSDGPTYLENNNGGKDAEGGEDAILLLVYPPTGNRFTEKVIEAYKGDVIVIAGTQCGNGFTGFKDEGVEEWIRSRPGWDLCVRMPLPSFAGKDEGLFVWRRRRMGERSVGGKERKKKKRRGRKKKGYEVGNDKPKETTEEDMEAEAKEDTEGNADSDGDAHIYE